MDIYGKVRSIEGSKTFIPFRYQGQYEDEEIGLYYNRYRYYSCDTGGYINQDPIGLAGNNPNFYAYVHDSNTFIDPFGLDEFFRGSKGDAAPDFTPRDPVKTKKGWQGDYRLDTNGNVATTHGVSIFDNADSVSKKGFTPNKLDSVPDSLKIIQRGSDSHHFEIVPKEPMSPDKYKSELKKIKCH